MAMKNQELSKHHIDVVDGIRAASVIIVMIFHFWQQTWIFPVIKTPWLSFISIGGRPLTQIDFTAFARAGYLFVDMMVLLSGFLLSLPLARCVLCGDKMQSWGTYFKKRAIRILPSYLFCIIALFIYELLRGGYVSNGVFDKAFALRDILSHLTFTHMLRVRTYQMTLLDAVLWTLAVEVWYYVLFPVIASFITWRRDKDGGRKQLAARLIRLTAAIVVMVGAAHLYIYKYVLAAGTPTAAAVDTFIQKLGCTIGSAQLSSTINQLPAFFGVYAIGLSGAFIYIAAAKRVKRNAVMSIIGTLLAIGFIVVITKLVKACASASGDAVQIWQVKNRHILSLSFMGFILTSAVSARWFRFLFSNKLMVILGGVSYNLYIWHQWLCVKLKYDWRLPRWTGDTPPNQLFGEFATKWKTEYAVIITVAAFAAAFAATYLIEKPAASLLSGRKNRRPAPVSAEEAAESAAEDAPDTPENTVKPTE